MLSPDDRVLLVDLLAPPEPGLRLEQALATTFTLHLGSLLPVPLALAGAELTEASDPLGVLQAIRTFADRIDVFCQAGQVAVPTSANALFAFLEPTVHQVRRPQPGRLFHPKLWILRFTDPSSDEERIRLVCGSRNLTADRAWDSVLSLDGRVTARPHSRNRPLHDFLASLPGRVAAGMPAARRDAVMGLADTVRYVEWEPPPGAVGDEWLAFHVLGPGRTAPELKGARRIVISPFVDEQGIDKVWPDGEGTIVSRSESLDALSDDYHRKLIEWDTDLLVLDENAAIADQDDNAGSGLRWSLSGLHAKTYLVDRGRHTHVFIGSANATGAAFGGNDELLVELVGRQSEWGVAATLANKSGSLSKLLVPYTRAELPEDPEADLRRQLENALRTMAELTFVATAAHEGEAWKLDITSRERVPAPPGSASLTARPLTIRSAQPVATGRTMQTSWALAGVEEITPFVVLTLSAPFRTTTVEASCTVVARLVGAPDDRLDQVLASHIGTPGAFIRFLLLLLRLAGREGPAPDLLGGDGGRGGFDGIFTAGNAGILEAVTTALATSPEAIDEIDRLVTHLQRTPSGLGLLPPGWEPFWSQVRNARERIARERIGATR